MKERSRLLNAEFKRMAALNMRIPLSALDSVKVSGAIDGLSLQTFELQQRISSDAHSGKNVLLLGDAVGNGPWNVGGGMHIWAISDGERLKKILTEVNGGKPLSDAFRKYSAGALKDSRAWGEKGFYYFYNNLSEADAAKVYCELRQKKI